MPGTVYVPNNHPNNFKIHYFDNGDPVRRQELQSEWVYFKRRDPNTGLEFDMLARPSNEHVEVAVDYLPPPDTIPGRYHVEVFVPGEYATTRRAVFTVTHERKDETGETGYQEDALVLVDMYDLYDDWYSLGDFELDKTHFPEAGRVRQFDITREDPPTQVAFGPVRWIPILPTLTPQTTLDTQDTQENQDTQDTQEPQDSQDSQDTPDTQDTQDTQETRDTLDTQTIDYNGPRFDSPVGTPEERNAPFPNGGMFSRKYPVWVGQWFDANPFLNWYVYGSHTGADLNLPGVSAADKGKPIYSIGDGVVTYAGRAGTWGNIIVIEHPDGVVTLPDGQVRRQQVHSRYGHVDDNILVRTGDAVARGQEIGYIGLAAGSTTGWHLHFDISYSGILLKRPAHWPDKRNSRETNKREVLRNYLDPIRFIQDNHNWG